MKVLNIHRRKIGIPINDVLELFKTLSTKPDKFWPIENWPPIKFINGLKIASQGGHGPIRYEITHYNPEGHIEFKFQRPHGFNGIHKFEIFELNSTTTEVKHTISMTTSGTGTLKWLLAISWLHNALIEDLLDKVENQLMLSNLKSEWNLWVKMLRWLLH